MWIAILAFGFVLGLVVPVAIAYALSRNATGGIKIVMFLSTFVMMIAMEIGMGGAVLFNWLSNLNF